jgi:hypothetical protein
LLLGEAFADISDLLLELEQLLVCHGVRVDVLVQEFVLEPDGEYEIPEILSIHKTLILLHILP